MNALPPLRQSSVEIASCPRAYVEIKINGKELPDSIPSERGSEVHQVMAQYVSHCARKRVPADWAEFNRLAAAVGPEEAGPILDGIRDSYEVDWAHVYGTEVQLCLDEDFIPTVPTPPDDKVENPREELLQRLGRGTAVWAPPAHEGTLDVIYLSDDGKSAIIPDYKTHPAPFDADTYQSILYPFMLFKHLPDLEEITFTLIFVRYRKCFRSVVWKRTDMPKMQAAVSRARERQRLTHAHPEDAKALPGPTCAYCPLAMDMSCPIAEFNPHMTLSLSDRVRWKVWMAQMSKLNNAILKEHAIVSDEAIRYEDGNGQVYEYGEQEVAETRYPLDASMLRVLGDWKKASGEDFLDGRLNVSSTKLKQLAKAQKRAPLRELLEASCIQTGTKPKYAVRTPEGILDEGNEYASE